MFVKLDNISVGKKLLMIYIFCVLIPILSINLILYSSTTKWVSMQEMNRVNLYMARTKASVTKAIEDSVAVAITLSSDSTLNGMMDKEYVDYLDYLADYRVYLENALSKFFQLHSHIQDITLYTDNKTIAVGGNYAHIDDSIMSTDWYDKILKHGRSVLIYPSIDSNGKRQFSLIKILNNLKFRDQYLKILKIDLRIDFFKNIVADDTIQGDLFLVNEKNDIVLSTKNDAHVRGERAFTKFETVDIDSNSVVSTVSLSNISYLSGWRLVGVFPAKSIFVELRRSRNYVIFLALLSLVLATTIVYFISRSLSTRLKALTKHMKKARKQNFEIIEQGIGNDELGELIVEFNMMATKIKELIQDVYQAEIHNKNLELERKQAELNALESQINPHFLYNTLNIIRMKSLLKNETETAEIIKCVAKTFRRIITWGNDLITIEEEMEFIREYLKIQKYRFENKVDYRINVQPGCLSYKIPKMSIQTFIENASIYGVENIKDVGIIALDISKDGQYLCCVVEDNGEGINEEQLKKILNELENDSGSGKSIGIRNVYKRLSSYYGNKFFFNMENCKDGGLKVTIKIPCEEV